MGLVGAGFVGPHHIDAVRRLGFVDVVALATSSDATARDKAQALGVPRGYGRFEALLDDPVLTSCTWRRRTTCTTRSPVPRSPGASTSCATSRWR